MIKEGPSEEDMNKKEERVKQRTFRGNFLVEGSSKSKGPEAERYLAYMGI